MIQSYVVILSRKSYYELYVYALDFNVAYEAQLLPKFVDGEGRIQVYKVLFT